MRKTIELLIKIKDRFLLKDVNKVMRPLIEHLRSYLPPEETQDNFDYFIFAALLEIFGVNDDTPRSEIIEIAKRYFEYFNTKGSSNTIRMAVKFIVFTIKNLRFTQQLSIHQHKLPHLFYQTHNTNELKKIQLYIQNNASHDSLAAKFICPLTHKPINTPAILRYNTSTHLMHPSYEYSLYELSALHDLVFFKTTDINPVNNQYIGSANIILDIKEICKIFNKDVIDLKGFALKK